MLDTYTDALQQRGLRTSVCLLDIERACQAHRSLTFISDESGGLVARSMLRNDGTWIQAESPDTRIHVPQAGLLVIWEIDDTSMALRPVLGYSWGGKTCRIKTNDLVADLLKALDLQPLER